MNTYNNYKELSGHTLCGGDRVNFTVENRTYNYIVHSEFLSNNMGDNSRIFDVLKLDREEKYYLASEEYGYHTKNGDWPNHNVNDFEASTRLVLALYKRIVGEITNWRGEME